MVRRNTETNVFHVLSWGARLKAASSLAAKTIVLCLRYLAPQTTYDTC